MHRPVQATAAVLHESSGLVVHRLSTSIAAYIQIDTRGNNANPSLNV